LTKRRGGQRISATSDLRGPLAGGGVRRMYKIKTRNEGKKTKEFPSHKENITVQRGRPGMTSYLSAPNCSGGIEKARMGELKKRKRKSRSGATHAFRQGGPLIANSIPGGEEGSGRKCLVENEALREDFSS